MHYWIYSMHYVIYSMWTVIFQNVISAIPTQSFCNANVGFGECVLEKKSSHMKNSFPKRDKCRCKTEIAMPVASPEIVFRKIALHKYICIHPHMKRSFPKHNLRTWHWYRKTFSFGMTLIAFWKRALHKYIIIYVFLHVYMTSSLKHKTWHTMYYTL